METITKIIDVCNLIKNIGKNQKPCFSDHLIINSDSVIDTLRRKYWYKESRNTNIEYMERIIYSIELLLSKKIGQEEIKDYTLLKKAIEDSIVGFENLIETYNDDNYIQSKYISYKIKFIYFNESLDKMIEVTDNNCVIDYFDQNVPLYLNDHLLNLSYQFENKNILSHLDRLHDLNNLKKYII